MALAGVIPVPTFESHKNDVTDKYVVFFRAVKEGNYGLVIGLIKNGIDINALDSDGSPALNVAASNEREKIIELLLQHGANATIADKDGWNAFHWAALKGNVNIARILMEYPISIVYIRDKKERTPLYYAVQAGKKQMIKFLIEAGRGRDGLIDDEYSLLHIVAADKEMLDIFELVLEMGFIVDISGKGQNLPLHFAAKYGNAKAVELLLKKGTSINYANEQGETALHLAVQFDSEGVVKLLVENKANLTLVNKQKRTPLHLAKKAKIAELLIRARAKVNVGDENGNSPLILATSRGDEKVVQLLIENGADVDFSNFNGETSLHYAVANDDETIVDLLLQNGANVSITNKDGKTPEQLATDKWNKKIIELIEKSKIKA